MTIRLSTGTLAEVAKTAAVPTYKADDLKAGILHFGVGNFHRAHQAVYLDDLFNLGESHDWALIGASVRPADEEMRRKLAAQDLLTTVVEREVDYSSARVTAAMIDYLKPGDFVATLGCVANPATRIVSLTITEGGYYIEPATQAFNPNHPDIIYDSEHPGQPRTVFGLIVAGLKRRRDHTIAPFTVMSCDNISSNGHVTRNAVVGLAELIDFKLADWIKNNVAFPNGMVDRITPATSDHERTVLANDFGIEDNWPVFCESFRQWVVEDHFPLGRPALELVGVQFVADVAPFELMKIRILNGGHATIAYPAALMDIHSVHEAMQNDLVHRLLNKVERDEIIPIVPLVPDTDPGEYYQLIERRFANPKIGDTVARLCYDGANRQPKFVLPSARDRLAKGQGVTGLALVAALWCRYCYGETESGKPIAPNDSEWERLQMTARKAKDNPAAWLEMVDIFGEIAQQPAYVAAFSSALRALWAQGTTATLERYLAGQHL